VDIQLKQRLVGAVVLVLLAVVVIPAILDGGRKESATPESPSAPVVKETEFSSSIIPLEESADKSTLPAPTPVPENITPPVEPSAVTEIRPPSENTQSAVAVTKPVPQPQTGIPSWVVQVAVLTSQSRADELVKSLEKKGFKAFKEKFYSSGGARYRIRVGPELKQEDAEKIRDRINREMKLKTMVVRYP